MHPALPMPLALGPFTSGWMLLWGAAALVPILLHLLNRRRQRTVSWAAMQFLAEAIQSQARRMRLWQLLLLLLRVVAIVLITLAVANPMFHSALDVETGTRDAKLHAFVIDTSFSMYAAVNDAEVEGPRRWERAQQALLEKLGGIPSGDGLLLVAMDDPPRPIIARATFDPELLRNALADVVPSYGTADVEATLSLLETLIADAQRTDRFDGGTEVTFFTDLQRPTWQRIATRDPAQRWQPLDRSASVELVDVTAGPPASDFTNLTVAELNLSPSLVFADQPAVIDVTLRASGNLPETEQRVQLKVDGKLRASQSLSFGASAQATASFTTSFTPGEKIVTVDLGSDLLPIDNERSLVLNVPRELRVLCVGPRSQTRYLAAAIRPGDQDWVQVTEVASARIASVEDESFDVVMLCDVPSPGAQLIRWLDRSASQGAGIVWWLGAAADAEMYRELQDARSDRLLPVRLVGPTTYQSYPVDPRAYEHPIAAAFREFPQSGLLSTPIFRYWEVRLPEEAEPESQVALGVGAESDPLLLTFRWPEHRVAVFTSAPAAAARAGTDADDQEEPWNALVAWPSFVPLVQETVGWLAASRFDRPRYVVGDRIQGTAESERAVVQRIARVGGDDVPVTARQQENGRWRWSSRSLTRPGVYQLSFPDGEVQLAAVNVDPVESDLSTVVGLTERQTFGGEGSFGEPERGDRSDARTGGPFRWILLVALAALLVESLFSRTMSGWRR